MMYRPSTGKEPTQALAKQRVSRISDATDALIVEEGRIYTMLRDDPVLERSLDGDVAAFSEHNEHEPRVLTNKMLYELSSH